jgi:DNA polymerase-3 subunit beta
MEVEDFPEMPNADGVDSGCKVNPHALADALHRAPLAMATEEKRYAIGNAVHFRLVSNRLHVVACDEKQMLLSKIKATDCKTGDWMLSQQTILPIKGASILARLCESMESDSSVSIGACGSGFFASSDNFKFACQQIAGLFPNYDRVIPKNNAKEITVKTKELADILECASHFTGEETTGISITAHNNKFSLKSADPFKGRAAQTIPCEYEGDEFKMCAKSQFWTTAVKLADKMENLTFQMNDSMKAAKMDIGQDVTYIFMPMDLRD